MRAPIRGAVCDAYRLWILLYILCSFAQHTYSLGASGAGSGGPSNLRRAVGALSSLPLAPRAISESADPSECAPLAVEEPTEHVERDLRAVMR